MDFLTQKDIDNWPKDEFGHQVFPVNSYFCKGASFGERAIFGEGTHFEKGAIFGIGAIFGAETYFEKGAIFGAGAIFREGTYFEKGASFGAGAIFGKNCIAKSLYWDFIYEPSFKTEGKIYPSENCRKYWEKRLGFKLGKCYRDIEKQIKPLLPKLLKKKKWTKCERRILESWL